MVQQPVNNRHMDPRQTAIDLNAKVLPQTEQVFDSLTGAQVGFVKVAAPTFTPDWQPSDCRCGPNSETRKHTSNGTCMSPGKHPMGPGWQGLATTKWPTAQTWLTTEGYSLGAYPLAGSRVVGLDEDVPGTMDDVPGWDQTLGDVTASGKRHAFFTVPDDVDPTTMESRWVGGDLLHDGAVRQFVAPTMLHPSGRRQWNGITTIQPIDRSTLERIGALKTNGTSAAIGEGVRIVVADDPTGYEPPEHIQTGGRHDEIARMVASLWNRKLSLAQIAVLVRQDLAPRFDEPMDDHRLSAEIEHAYETLARKGWEPNVGRPPLVVVPDPESDEVIVLDPLDIEQRSEDVEALDPHQMDLPIGLAMLLDHYERVSDASWSNLLLASTVMLGALMGPKPTLQWRGRQRASVFGVLVGDANYGRKGQTMRVVGDALTQVDPALDEITKRGVSSGEALVDTLIRSRTTSVGSVLMLEHELRGMLTVAGREGNTLSPVLRQMWDGDTVSTVSRTKGEVAASGYSASFLGGVTPTDLARLPADDVTNGWANRFLWFHSEPRRDGMFDPLRDTTLSPTTATYLRECIDRARTLGGSMLVAPRFTMTLEPVAYERLEALVAALDVKPIGPIGSLRQRIPAHAVRLAMVAALLDQSAVVESAHVAFGEQMAGYAVRSMRAVIGVQIDDEVARAILGVLRQAPDGWLNTSSIAKSMRKDPARCRTALERLMAANLIEREVVMPASGSKGGRPAVGYRLRRGS